METAPAVIRCCRGAAAAWGRARDGSGHRPGHGQGSRRRSKQGLWLRPRPSRPPRRQDLNARAPPALLALARCFRGLSPVRRPTPYLRAPRALTGEDIPGRMMLSRAPSPHHPTRHTHAPAPMGAFLSLALAFLTTLSPHACAPSTGSGARSTAYERKAHWGSSESELRRPYTLYE